jgi:hypothetical protein
LNGSYFSMIHGTSVTTFGRAEPLAVAAVAHRLVMTHSGVAGVSFTVSQYPQLAPFPFLL